MSEIGLQLIAENKRTKNPSLDLGRCGLREIPKALFDCVWLEELVLSNEWWDDSKRKSIESKNRGNKNFISFIPATIKKLEKLKSLRVGGGDDWWNISNISSLQALKELRYLDLRSNEISDISFLQSLKDLQFLDLSSNQISDIKSLKSLAELKFLDLSFNQIADASSLQSLRGLQSLSLS